MEGSGMKGVVNLMGRKSDRTILRAEPIMWNKRGNQGCTTTIQ